MWFFDIANVAQCSYTPTTMELPSSLCFTQLIGEIALSWVPITLNLAVHVVMYYCYFQVACGNRVWFKKYMMMMQIVQFVVDLAFTYFATYTYFAHETGSIGAARGPLAPVTGVVTLSSYLVLFVGFYFMTYREGDKSSNQPRVSATSLQNMEEGIELRTMSISGL